MDNQRFANPAQAFVPSALAAENARFMSGVYGWMTSGLCVTGVVAWNVAGNPEMVREIFGNRLLFRTLIIAQLGAVAALSSVGPSGFRSRSSSRSSR